MIRNGIPFFVCMEFCSIINNIPSNNDNKEKKISNKLL